MTVRREFIVGDRVALIRVESETITGMRTVRHIHKGNGRVMLEGRKDQYRVQSDGTAVSDGGYWASDLRIEHWTEEHTFRRTFSQLKKSAMAQLKVTDYKTLKLTALHSILVALRQGRI